MISASRLMNLCLASLIFSASMPKMIYLLLMTPLFPFADRLFNISENSSRISSNLSPWGEISNCAASVSSFTCLLKRKI